MLRDIDQLFNSARNGHWENVFCILNRNPRVLEHKDILTGASGKEVIDLAVLQQQIEAIKNLVEHFHLYPSLSQIKSIAIDEKSRAYFYQLVSDKLININRVYQDSEQKTGVTLLDVLPKNELLLEFLRMRYFARTYAELSKMSSDQIQMLESLLIPRTLIFSDCIINNTPQYGVHLLEPAKDPKIYPSATRWKV